MRHKRQWSEGNPPSHTATIPFVRGLAGPVDYTPGIFDLDYSLRAAQRVKWNDQQKGATAGHSTLMNQLALMYVLYSPLQMAADLPENYKDNPNDKFQISELKLDPVELNKSGLLAKNGFVSGNT